MQIEPRAMTRAPIAVIGDTAKFIPELGDHTPGWIADALLLAADAIIITNSDDDILFFNHASEKMFDYRCADLAIRDLEALLPSWRELVAKNRSSHHLRNDLGFSDVIGHRRDGSLFNAELSVANTVSRGARIEILTLRDLSKSALEESASERKLIDQVNTGSLLLRELRHRIKNNFQVLLSMIHMEKSQPLGSEALAELQTMENRINALNGVDGELALAGEDQPIAFASYLRHLADGLATVFSRASTPVAFDLALDEVDVSAKTASHLGLLINEAVTNTFKHAVPRGATAIALAVTNRDGNMVLTISDNGPGCDPSHAVHVGGTALMHALARQLGATLEHDQQKTGMQYTIRMPILVTTASRVSRRS